MSELIVFCFPFAGGSKYSYTELEHNSNDQIVFKALETPGRGDRFNEALLDNMEALVDDLYDQLLVFDLMNFAFYGHSMGALLAYLLTKKLIENQEKRPKYLFLSGKQAPMIPPRRSSVYQLPKHLFFEKLASFGGLTEEVLGNKDLLNDCEPILRADFTAVETYQYQKTDQLNIPITVLYGDQEQFGIDEVSLWKEETTGAFEMHQFAGNHFFIYEHFHRIIQIIISASERLRLKETLTKEHVVYKSHS